MKTITTKPLILAAFLGLGLQSTVMADDLLWQSDRAIQQFDSDQIDIDGNPRDRLNEARRRLEQQNEQMVQRRIEDQRIKQERELARQLQKAFTQGIDARDEVRSTMAAAEPVTVPQIIAEAPAPAPVVVEKPNKIIPVFGVANIKGERIDFESKINMGLSFESMLTKNFSVGVGLGYTGMDIKDFSNTFVTQPVQNINTFYNPGYFQSFGQGRDIEYNNLTMNVNGKVFLSSESKIRPFVGGSLNYSRAKLKYTDNGNNYSFNSVQFGSEGYSSSFVGATGMIGSEVVFTEQIGMNLDFRYTRGLTSGFNSSSEVDPFQNPDQRRLENIGQAIEDADFFSLNLGLVVRF